MISSLSKTRPTASIDAVVEYFLATSKSLRIWGTSYIENRDPVPEILAGDPVRVTAAVAGSGLKSGFHTLTLTFHEHDINVERFNRGDPDARRIVAGAIESALDFHYAGVDADARPPVLCATHAHTRHLELNFILPAFVTLDRCRPVAFDLFGATLIEQDWRRFDDALNMVQGWQVTGGNGRRARLRGKDSYERMRAAALRLGIQIGPDKGPVFLLNVAHRAIADSAAEDPDSGIAAIRDALADVADVEVRKTGIRLTMIDPPHHYVFLSGTAVTDHLPQLDPDAKWRRTSVEAALEHLHQSHAYRAREVRRRFRKENWPTDEVLDYRMTFRTPVQPVPSHHPDFFPRPDAARARCTSRFAEEARRLLGLTRARILDWLAYPIILSRAANVLIPRLTELCKYLENANEQRRARGTEGPDAAVDRSVAKASDRKSIGRSGATNSGHDGEFRAVGNLDGKTRHHSGGRAGEDGSAHGLASEDRSPGNRTVGDEGNDRKRERGHAERDPAPDEGVGLAARPRRIDLLKHARQAAATVWPDEQPIVRFQPSGERDAVSVDLEVQGTKLQIGAEMVEAVSGQVSKNALEKFARSLSERLHRDYATTPEEDQLEEPGM